MGIGKSNSLQFWSDRGSWPLYENSILSRSFVVICVPWRIAISYCLSRVSLRGVTSIAQRAYPVGITHVWAPHFWGLTMNSLFESNPGCIDASVLQEGEDSCLRDLWKNDLDMATEIELMSHFPMGLFGYELSRQTAVRKGTIELFDERMDALRDKISKALLARDPMLARAHANRLTHVSEKVTTND